MKKMMCLAYLGALLLAVQLFSSPVVQAQTLNTTTASMNNMTYTTMMPNSTMNTTKGSGCGRTDAFTLLLPLAVAASLLHGWS